MNPIAQFREARNREAMAGGKPIYCIMGDHDFAAMAGAVGILFDLQSAVGMDDELVFEGVRIRRARSQKIGIMIG